jgi:hypothetical protein
MTNPDVSRWTSVGFATAMAVGVGLSAGACRKTAAERHAEQVRAQADRMADDLRARADDLERSGGTAAQQQADQLRAQADQVRQQGQAQASEAEHARGDHAARGGGPAMRAAMRSYAEARCDREARCHHLGVGQRYRDRAVCLADEANNRSQNWEAADECRAHSVNQARLAECLNAVRTDDCNDPVDALSRLSACSPGEVCGR